MGGCEGVYVCTSGLHKCEPLHTWVGVKIYMCISVCGLHTHVCVSLCMWQTRYPCFLPHQPSVCQAGFPLK